MIKALSLDWEGCVSEPGGSAIPWPTQKIAQLAIVLAILREHCGTMTFINTGRQGPYVEAGLQALGAITSIPSICENGSVLYYPTTKEWVRNPAITDEKFRKFKEIELALFEIVNRKQGKVELGKNFSFSTNPPSSLSIESYFDYIVVEIQKLNIGTDILEVTHSMSAVDITPAGVNKASGLEFWLQKTGIVSHDVAAVGDSRGDFPVLSRVGLALCPANSTEETKKLVRERNGYVSHYRTALGVIDSIKKLTDDGAVHNLISSILSQWALSQPIETIEE